MSGSRRRFSREFKDEPCWAVTSKTIRAVAEENGVGAKTLRTSLKKYRTENALEGSGDALKVAERARLKEHERENRKLKAECQLQL